MANGSVTVKRQTSQASGRMKFRLSFRQETEGRLEPAFEAVATMFCFSVLSFDPLLYVIRIPDQKALFSKPRMFVSHFVRIESEFATAA
jgi:hypothetical protein